MKVGGGGKGGQGKVFLLGGNKDTFQFVAFQQIALQLCEAEQVSDYKGAVKFELFLLQSRPV